MQLDGLKYDWARFILSRYRNSQLRDLLEEQRAFVRGMDQDNVEELRRSIQEREAALSDDEERDKLFEDFLKSLPPGEVPQSYRETARQYQEWETGQQAELARWKRQLTAWENDPIDKHFVLFCARGEVTTRSRDIDINVTFSSDPFKTWLIRGRDSGAIGSRGSLNISAPFDSDSWWDGHPDFRDNLLMETLLLESHSSGLWPDDGWVALDWLHAWKEICDKKSLRLTPRAFRDDTGKVSRTADWRSLITEVAEWIVRQGDLSQNDGKFESFNGRTLINVSPLQTSGSQFRAPRQLSNSLYLETDFGTTDLARLLL